MNDNEEYHVKVFKHSVADGDFLRKHYNLDDTKFWKVMFEFLYFYLSVTDRIAFRYMDKQKKDDFITDIVDKCILTAVNAISEGWSNSKIQESLEGCQERYKECKLQWAQYKFGENKDDNPKNTLFWEFGRHIGKLIETDDYINTLLVAEIATDSLVDLNPKTYIENITQ